ncbi:MAG: topoisomerase DNA-binding C4 zinc finger domain-containing protein, partial [Alphaproteobacteria bacterium]|nr:topoisomerase DNA-binding C4 zinc finger domain-containing protein [Alphaproteobacteria bacterium]
DPGEGENGGILPPLAEGETPTLTKATSEQHFTQPPPRYSEASLVKKLEELGIGRPSTYASILDVLRRRDYVRMDNRRFVPEDRGRLVTAFLTAFFERYVEYDFTAQLEDGLDDISDGRMPWKRLLRDFWSAFGTAVDGTKDLTISQVIDALDEALGPHFFPVDASGADPRRCTECGTGRLGLRLGRHGAFIGCSNYPDCKHTRSLEVPVEGRPAAAGPRELGTHPDTGEPVSLRKGPYGLYVQLGEESEGATRKPKRASLAKGVDPATVDLDTALKLLALPREVGPHPGDGEPIVAGIGPFGPYLRHQSRYVSLRGDDDVLTIGINRAVILVDQAHEKARASLLHEVGAHPKDGKPITVNKGRFGPYIKHGRVFCPLPKDRTPESIGVDEAVALLAAKSAKGKGKGKGKKAPRRKAAAKKAPAK